MILNGKDGLKEVGKKDGKWNWCLVGPNPEKLPLVGGGMGSIDDLRDCLARQEAEMEKEKQFVNFYGLMRLKFGTGRMSRIKYAFLQASRVDDKADEVAAAKAAGGGDDESHTRGASSLTSSAVKHGQALGQRGAMEKALSEFAHFHLKIESTRLSDLSVENIVEKVKAASTADAELVTVDGYKEGVAEFRAKYGVEEPESPSGTPAPAPPKPDATAAAVAEIFDEEMAPAAETAEPEMEKVDEDDEEEHSFPMEKILSTKPEKEDEDAAKKKEEADKQAEEAEANKRRMSADERMAKELQAEEDAKLAEQMAARGQPPAAAAAVREATAEAAAPSGSFPTRVVAGQMKKGDLLFVYSNATKQWMDDGVIVQVLDADGTHDGLKLPKDAVKVQYNNRRQFKWITPAQTNAYLRPSRRPAPPPTLLGELLKETHQWITVWHVRYFELSKGYLQWWLNADDAKNGVVPNGSLSLSGLEMSLQGTVLHLRTHSSKGMIYAFDATSVESASKWAEMLKKHEEYCRKMQFYLTNQARDLEAMHADGGEEKTSGMIAERKRRNSLHQS